MDDAPMAFPILPPPTLESLLKMALLKYAPKDELGFYSMVLDRKDLHRAAECTSELTIACEGGQICLQVQILKNKELV